MYLDIQSNRKACKYTNKELVLRILWAFVMPLFRYSPRLCWGWRRFLLRRFGAKVGQRTHIFPSVKIFAPWHFAIGEDSSIGFDALIYNLGHVCIGDRVTISQRTHICAGTHDFETKEMQLVKPPIQMEDEVWVCADAFIGPGITLKRGAVVAAGSVVVKDVEEWNIVGGNPAKVIKKRVINS